jgi:hypothetical protein
MIQRIFPIKRCNENRVVVPFDIGNFACLHSHLGCVSANFCCSLAN